MREESKESARKSNPAGELNIDDLDKVVGGVGSYAGVKTDDNNAQLLTDVHMSGPNSLMAHPAPNPGVPPEIQTGTHAGPTVTHDATSFDASVGASAGVATTQNLGGNVNWTGQAGVGTDASFHAGITGVSAQAGTHAIASSSLQLDHGVTINDVARADADVYGKVGITGAKVGAEAGASAIHTFAQTNSGDVGHGTTLGNTTTWDTGVKANAGAHAGFGLNTDGNFQATVGVNSYAGAYNAVSETAQMDSHGVGASAGVTGVAAGSVGVGFAPTIGEQDGKYTVGIHVGIAAAVGGGAIDGSISLDKNMVNNFVVDTVGGGITHTASNIAHDPLVQLAAQTYGQLATDAAHSAAHGATDAAHTVAHGATDAAHTVGHGATSAAHTVGHGITDTAHAAGHGITTAAHTVGHGITGAAHTVGHGITDSAHAAGHGISTAAHTVGHGITGAAHTAGHGISTAAHTVGHGITGAAHTVGHGITDTAHAAGHGISTAGHTVGHGATHAAHTVAHGASNAAHTVAHGATNAAHTVAHGATHAAHTVSHGVSHAAHTVSHAFSSAAHAVANAFRGW